MIIVDGYNFLYAVLGMEHSLPIDDLGAARSKIQEYLSRYHRIVGERVRVVYDARGAQLPNEEYGGVDVVYAPPGSTADDQMVRSVQRSPRPGEVTVVTSDKDLGERVKAAGGRTLRCRAFYKRMLDAFEQGANPPDNKAREKPSRPEPEEIDHFLREFGEDRGKGPKG